MPTRLLIIRFSAMGDVALLVPVVRWLAEQYPQLQITVLTRQRMSQLFAELPSNVCVMGIDLGLYKGFRGLNRLYRELSAEGFDAVADLHDVLRTKYLRRRFRWAGVPVVIIDKGRAEKKALIGHGLTAQPLKHTTERYAEALGRVGFQVQGFKSSRVQEFKVQGSGSRSVLPPPDGGVRGGLGIAPFAAHEAKIYPLDRMREVANQLAELGYQVYLFGAGEKEKAILESWQRPGVTSVCGKLPGLHAEIQLMRRLQAMIAMDSANMHIAALAGIPVISIWGATHPKAGFTPWRQPASHIIQDESLSCRPCSVYGNRPCRFGDYRCMTRITPQQIVQRVLSVISTNP